MKLEFQILKLELKSLRLEFLKWSRRTRVNEENHELDVIYLKFSSETRVSKTQVRARISKTRVFKVVT